MATVTTPTPTCVQGRPSLAAYGHLLIIYIVWGSTYFAVRVVVTGPAHISPVALQTARMWCAVLLLGTITWLRVGPPRGIGRREVILCSVTGVLMWVTGNGLATLASPHATSSFVVMAMGMIPLWSIGLEAVVTRRLPSLWVVVALVTGLVGLALVVAPAFMAAGGAIVKPGWGVPVVLMLVGAGITWALGSRLQRPLSDRMNTGWIATFQMIAAAVALSGWTIATPSNRDSVLNLGRVDWEQIAAFSFLVIFGSAIALSSYVVVVRSFSAAVASTFAYVNPVVGLFLGGILLHERIAPLSVVGLAAVLGSVAVVLQQSAPHKSRS